MTQAVTVYYHECQDPSLSVYLISVLSASLQCSVTCGIGYKQRKVWCMKDGQKVDDEECSKKKPPGKKECSLEECPEWYTGGWGPVSLYNRM